MNFYLVVQSRTDNKNYFKKLFAQSSGFHSMNFFIRKSQIRHLTCFQHKAGHAHSSRHLMPSLINFS